MTEYIFATCQRSARNSCNHTFSLSGCDVLCCCSWLGAMLLFSPLCTILLEAEDNYVLQAFISVTCFMVSLWSMVFPRYHKRSKRRISLIKRRYLSDVFVLVSSSITHKCKTAVWGLINKRLPSFPKLIQHCFHTQAKYFCCVKYYRWYLDRKHAQCYSCTFSI